MLALVNFYTSNQGWSQAQRTVQVKNGPSDFPKAEDSDSPEITTQLSLGWPELPLFGAVCFEWCHYFIFKLPIMHPLKIP